MRATTVTRRLLPLAALALVAGCTHPSLLDPARQGPFFAPTNVVGAPTLGGIRRVVLLPVCGGTLAPEEAVAAFDPIFAAALQRTNRFEVVTLSRETCREKFHAPEFSSAAALPHNFLAELRREFAADAVLFVDLTAFNAYRPLALGLRAKLAVLDPAAGAQLLWSFDNLFSAADSAVANAARHHYLDADRGVPADLSVAALLSPSRFAGYAASAMFSTLPPVVVPLAETAKRRR